MPYTIPAPTTLTVPFVLPSSYSAADLEALACRIAGESFVNVSTADVCDSSSGTVTISLRLTFKRMLPVLMHEALHRLHVAAVAELGARQHARASDESPFREAWEDA